MKEGDKFLTLVRLMELEKMAEKREVLAKTYRLAVWKTEKKLTDLLEGNKY